MRTWLRQRLAAHGGILAPLALLQVISVGGTAAAPVLHDSPLLLVGLAPRLPFLALAAQDTPLLPFLLIATARLCVADPLHFRIGRRLENWAVASRRDRLLDRWVARAASAARARHGHIVAAVLVFVRPISRHLTLAGAAGVRAPAVAFLDVAGTVIYLIVIRECGRALW